ncbi:hypothetical protein ABT272_41595 [Streptomyces sp900105245]|uniref:Uncharacterized protein n=1 Tax=Streptomyces sp. 900105245 TaxID=3154379 RepID=A0ABV1UK63_9ACTN
MKKGEPDSELARYAESQRKVVACLRKEGFDVPDPDARGLFDSSRVGKDAQALRGLEKCEPLGLPMPESLKEDLEPVRAPEEIAVMKRFGECMRENGAPDYPEMNEKGNLEDWSWHPTNAAAKHASQFCNKKIYGVDVTAVEPKG